MAPAGRQTRSLFQWSAKDWWALAPVVHNRFMIVTYANGTVLKAVVLTHEEHEIRAIAPGCDDVLAFAYVQGAWTSEEFEAVNIEFELERPLATPPALEADCIC